MSEDLTRIDKFNRGIDGGIAKSIFSYVSASSEGFHISMGNPSICVPKKKHNKTIKAKHVRLANPCHVINVIFKTQN